MFQRQFSIGVWTEVSGIDRALWDNTLSGIGSLTYRVCGNLPTKYVYPKFD